MFLSLEHIVQILDSIDSYALPGKFNEQREREYALIAASHFIISMSESWVELKETIEELIDNGGKATQKEVCTFLASLMEVLENGKKED